MVCIRIVSCPVCDHAATVRRVGACTCNGSRLLRYRCPGCGNTIRFLCEAEERAADTMSKASVVDAYVV